MNRYTVIGGAGFVGSHVVAKLRATGIEPWCPGRDESPLFENDLGCLIYCAGLTGDYRARPFATVEAHVSLLARLIERASFERVVYLSSTRLYDQLPGGIGREDQSIPVDPHNEEHLYELSKMLGESLTLHRTAGRGVVARLSYAFGWDNDSQGFLSDWLRAAEANRSLVLDSSPCLSRDYIHVDDVAAALIAIADSTATGIVNIARGEVLSNAEIAAVFHEYGWDVRFLKDGSRADRASAIDCAKLEEMGVTARPVLALIGEYLARLNSLTEQRPT